MKKPNILFILIDDLGWKDLSISGSKFYETPCIDSLATRGMCFSNAYASCPVCSPSRASMLTGKYPAHVGITDWIDWTGGTHPAKGRLIDVPYLKALPTGEYTLARALKDDGYETWHVGKWHLGGAGSLPEDHGFEINVGGCECGSPIDGGYFSPWGIPPLKDADVPEGTYLTDYLTDRAIELMKGDRDKPFYLNLWYYTVHTPIEAKEEKIKKYERKRMEMGLDKLEEFADGGPFPTEHKRHLNIKRRLVQSDPVYAAMIESLDENIGRILQALDEVGEADNTLVIFTSDNGGLATAEGSPTCNAPLAEGKGWMYEGGTREPLFVCWPGRIEPGSFCEEPVTTPDFYPTILEATGTRANPDHEVDGVSILPLLRGASTLDREAIFWHYPHYGNQGGTPGSSVRMGDYKLIHFYEDDRIELYNLREAIGETVDLSHSEKDMASYLWTVLKNWQKSVEAKIPQANPEWDETR